MSLGNEMSQAVVRDYLLHHGYADTLAAFDRSSACTDEDPPKASAPSPSANGHRCLMECKSRACLTPARLACDSGPWGRLRSWWYEWELGGIGLLCQRTPKCP